MSSVPDVRIERVSARALASARSVTSQARIGDDIRRLLDLVWPVVRGQGVRTGHNVVVYHRNPMTIEAGVEILGEFTENELVRRAATPAGEVATTTHWGEYSAMHPAYQALEDWRVRSGQQFGGVSWEVYGDWAEDPANRRTDIYFLLRSESGRVRRSGPP